MSFSSKTTSEKILYLAGYFILGLFILLVLFSLVLSIFDPCKFIEFKPKHDLSMHDLSYYEQNCTP